MVRITNTSTMPKKRRIQNTDNRRQTTNHQQPTNQPTQLTLVDSGTDFVADGGFQVNVDSTRDVFSRGSLAEEGVE